MLPKRTADAFSTTLFKKQSTFSPSNVNQGIRCNLGQNEDLYTFDEGGTNERSG